MQKRPSFFFILSFIAAFVVFSSCQKKPQNECGFVQNIYGQRISWKSDKPVDLYIHSSVPMALRSSIYKAAATWESQIGHPVFRISEDSSKVSASPSRDQKNGIYFLPKWESDKTSEQGRTSVYWASDTIVEADILVNASDFAYYGTENSKTLYGGFRMKQSGRTILDGYNFEALMLHEMGHMLGLKHQEGSSVMKTYLGAFENRTRLAAVDQKMISCEYN